jgi:hypothetical protein
MQCDGILVRPCYVMVYALTSEDPGVSCFLSILRCSFSLPPDGVIWNVVDVMDGTIGI